MFRCIQDVRDSDGLQMCRLCLAEDDDLVYIFNRKGCRGFRLWEIIEELIQEEVSKEDGLPWTVCKGCVCKVKDFKQFKMTCIRAKSSILTMLVNRGFVSSVKEEIETDESSTGAEFCSQEILHLGETAHMGVSNDSSLANPLDLSDMNKEADASKSFLHAETFNLDNDQHNENFDVRVSNVVCLPIQFGDRGHYEEEDDPSISMIRKEAHGGESIDDDESLLASVSNVTTPQQSAGIMGHDCSTRGGIPKACEKTPSDLRGEGKIRIQKKLKRNVLPGGHTLRNNCNLSSRTAGHQMKKKLSTKESELFQLRDNIRNTVSSSDVLPYDMRCANSDGTHRPGNAAYVCNYCGVKYMDKKTLVLHVRDHILRCRPSSSLVAKDSPPKCSQLKSARHNGSKLFHCKACGKEFKWRSSLRRHLRMHRGLKPFKCDTCGKRFSQKCDLMRHSLVHSGLTAFKCKSCGREFKHKKSLQRHSITHN